MERSVESALKKWKKEKNRLPIILRGARQVGKSFLVEKLGKQLFDSMAIVNFELRPDLAKCFDNLDPVTICARLEILLGQSIIPEKTLLFLDEIQNCPQAITALRYFKEKLPTLHVIAAGSLLEFVLHEGKFSFPVGRVQFMYLRPLSFVEYLSAQNQHRLIDYLDNLEIAQPTDEAIHQLLLNYLRQYFLIGGMPAPVLSFVEEHSFLDCQRIMNGLLDTYRSDFGKYATKTQHKYLEIFFNKGPGLIGQHFKYSHVNPDLRSRELKVALEQLGWAGLMARIHATSGSGIPLSAHTKENKFKLLFLDLGLLNCANKIDLQSIWDTNLTHLNAGAQAEQFVGQELLAYSDFYSNTSLYYWERDKKGSMAEVDY